MAEAVQVCDARDHATAESTLQTAIATGAVPVFRDRHDLELIFAEHLRDADLLREPADPHGLATSTTQDIVSLLIPSIDRGRDLGAPILGTYRLRAIEPVAANRRQPAGASGPTCRSQRWRRSARCSTPRFSWRCG